MPAETPAAVITRPSSTQRSATGVAPRPVSRSRNIQCVVARLPSSNPAAPRIIEPVQTDVTSSAPAAAVRSQARRRSSDIARSVGTVPPGTSTA
jgi:hypothetical protein